MVDSGAVVVGDVAQHESPARRDWRDVDGVDRKPVTLRVVLSSYAKEWITVAVETEGIDIGLKRLCVTHFVPQLQPRTVEQPVVDHPPE
jgi:hypothetical protein